MSAIDLFTYADKSVRVLMEDGEPMFVASDIADILGYRMASDLTRALDEDERGTRPVRTPSGEQEMTVITEPGLYRAINQRQTGRMANPETASQVRAFQRWVTHEVLPAIRRTGTYSTQQTGAPVDVAAIDRATLARWVIEAEDARRAAEAEVAILAPKAAFTDQVLTTSGDYSVREAAQILTRDHGITIGQNRLFVHMRSLKWVDSRSTPYQRHIEIGRLVVRVRTFEHPHTGEPTLATQVRITPRGLLDLHASLASTQPALALGGAR